MFFIVFLSVIVQTNCSFQTCYHSFCAFFFLVTAKEWSLFRVSGPHEMRLHLCSASLTLSQIIT